MDLEERFALDNQFKTSFNISSHFFISKFSLRQRETAAFGFITSLVWGTLMKHLIYKNLLKSKLLNRPINLMILVDEAIHHVTNGFLMIQLITWMMSGSVEITFFRLINLGDLVSHHLYCKIITCVGIFTFQYATFGSVGIAIFRVLYFEEFKWATKVNNNKKMVVCMPLITIAMTIINSSLFLRGPGTGRIAYSSCMGRTENFQACINISVLIIS